MRKKYGRAAIFAIACLSTITGFAQIDFGYEVSGKIEGLKNDSLVLFVRYNNDPQTLLKADTIIAVGRDDNFIVKGKARNIGMVYAQVGFKRSGNFTFFIEPGKIRISGRRDSLDDVKVAGTPYNDDYFLYSKRTNYFYDQLPPLYAQLKERADKNDPESQQINLRIGALRDSVDTYRHEYAKKYPATMAAGMSVYLLQDKIPVAELESLYLGLDDKVKSLVLLSKVPERIAAKKNAVVGALAADFTMKDVDGKEVSLKDFKGKFVLLDFWASWCVPCRAENPSLVAAYNKYKDKGFVIIGISMDHIAEKWKEAIAKDQLTWTHVSDLNAFENKAAKIYGVQPIPDNFLINPIGKIIGRGYHGEALAKKLAEVYDSGK